MSHAYLHLPRVIMTESASGEVRYLLSDGLGSVRQVTDEAGQLVSTHEFAPYGVPLTEPASAPYGYTGEWWQADIGLLHLRARWYEPHSGTFLSVDPVESEPPYQYVGGNVTNWTDPSGLQPPWVEEEQKIEQALLRSLKSALLDTAQRLNNPQITNMNNKAFAAMLGAKIIMEDAYWDAVSPGRERKRWESYLPSLSTLSLINFIDQPAKRRQISWGIMNIPTHLGNQVLNWWESGGYIEVGKNHEDFQVIALNLNYAESPFDRWNPHDVRTSIMIYELEHEDKRAIEYMGAGILFSAYEATELKNGQIMLVLNNEQDAMCRIVYPRFQDEVSAYIIASGVIHHGAAASPLLGSPQGYGTVYNPAVWKEKGSQGVWTDAIPDVASILGLIGLEYMPYMSYEVNALPDAQVNKHNIGARIGP